MLAVSLIIILLGEQEVRDGGQEGDGPAENGDDDDPGEVGCREGEEGVADDEISLQGEGEDRHDRGVAGAVQHPEIRFSPQLLMKVSHLSDKKDLSLQKISPKG